MLRSLSAAAFIAALAPLPAHASSSSQRCLDAYAEGDRQEGDRIAQSILDGRWLYSEADADQGSRCLKELTGKDYIYYRPLRQFLIPGTEQEAIKNKAAEDAAYEKKLSDERMAARAAEKAKAEQLKRDEESKAEFMAMLDQRRRDRKSAVNTRLNDACTELYAEDEVAAITNKLCLDVFLVGGLPD